MASGPEVRVGLVRAAAGEVTKFVLEQHPTTRWREPWRDVDPWRSLLVVDASTMIRQGGASAVDEQNRADEGADNHA